MWSRALMFASAMTLVLEPAAAEQRVVIVDQRGLEPAVRGVFQKELALLIGPPDEGLMRELFSSGELTSDDPTPSREISMGR